MKKKVFIMMICLAVSAFLITACSKDTSSPAGHGVKKITISAKASYFTGEEIKIASNMASGYTAEWSFLHNDCGARIISSGTDSAVVMTDREGCFSIVQIGTNQEIVVASDVLKITVFYNIVNVYGTADFLSKAQFAKYVLQNDIDFGGARFEPVAAFSGVLDGQGFAVKNLTVENHRFANSGVIGVNGGTVKNISFKNINIESMGDAQNVGIVGINEGRIENVKADGSVFADLYTNAGGICGLNKGVITDCENNAAVTGGINTGGIAGRNEGTVFGNLNAGAVTGKKVAGGITGLNFSADSLRDNVNKGRVKALGDGASYAGDWAGGIAGMSVNADLTRISNSLNYGEISGVNYIGGICGQAETLAYCINYGKVTGAGANTGGIAGQVKTPANCEDRYGG